MARKLSAEITKKRMLVAFTGFLVGACVGLLFGRFVTVHYFSSWILIFGGLGMSKAVLGGEKRKGLPTKDDLAAAIFDGQFSPLGLSAASIKRGTTGEETTAQERKRGG